MIKRIFFSILCSLAVASTFAEVGYVNDDNEKDPKKPETHHKMVKGIHSFSLRSGMYFRGENLINSDAYSKTQNQYVYLNKIAFKNGEDGYLMLHNKKAALNKLTFNPNELLRNHSRKY